MGPYAQQGVDGIPGLYLLDARSASTLKALMVKKCLQTLPDGPWELESPR